MARNLAGGDMFDEIGDYGEEDDYTDEEDEGFVPLDDNSYPDDFEGPLRVLQERANRQAEPEAAEVRPEKPRQVEPWTAFNKFPPKVKAELQGILEQMRQTNRNELTVVVLGKGGAGKSALINSMLNEEAVKTASVVVGETKQKLQAGRVSKRVGEPGPTSFTLTLIDCPSVLDGCDSRNMRIQLLRRALKNTKVDAFIYVDRFDLFRVDESDTLLIRDLTQALGKDFWSKTIVGLTHANLNHLPPGTDYEGFKQERIAALRARIRSEGGNKGAQLPLALIENGSRCPKNSDFEKVLPDGTAWLSVLFEKVREVALTGEPYVFRAKQVNRSLNPNRKWRWAIPFIFAAQVWFKIAVLDPLLEQDGWQGDQHGPYDPEFAKAEKARRLKAKAEREARSDRGRSLGGTFAAIRGKAIDSDDSDED
eukprot:jgi/Botrbrau1/19557/Bobra.0035s0049.1